MYDYGEIHGLLKKKQEHYLQGGKGVFLLSKKKSFCLLEANY